MSAIRRQSIISSIVIYLGFAVGMLNVYFFTKDGLFTPAQYGLTKIFMDISVMIGALAGFSMPSFIFKFHPYYFYHLPPQKNDMVTWALLLSIIGFILVATGGWVFKDLVIRKFGANSPELVTYYNWVFPMGFGVVLFATLEAYGWAVHKSVFTNFLKEILWRVIVLFLILLFIIHIISGFDGFIKLYALAFPIIAFVLLFYLVFTNRIHFTLKTSKVTRRHFKKILAFCVFSYSGSIVFTLSQIFDSLVIAAVLEDGLSKAGIFGLAQIMTSIIQAPQRGIVAASIAHLARAWKDKDIPTIQRIYERSSINLLLFAVGIFALIVLNYKDAITTFGLRADYLAGFTAFIFLGLTKVVDLGTGVNPQIIATSNYWRFDLFSGILLVIIMLPLTYILTKQYDILGPAIASLISISIYNLIRIAFLWYKYKLQPFTLASLYTILIAVFCFVVSYFAFINMEGMMALILRSALFMGLYGIIVIYFKLSPDIEPVWNTIRKRLTK